MNTKSVALSFLFSALLFSCGKKEQQPQGMNAAPSLPVTEISNKEVTGYTAFPVNIEGKVNNDVRAKIQGYIIQVFVDEGQIVSKGQPLFKLETNVLSQNANAAKSGVTAAQASVKAAEASVRAAQVEVDKLVPLVEKNIISNVQLETAKANLMRAQSQLSQAQASYQQAKANFSGIQANIDFSVVRSPISGVVGAINFREGSLVGPSDPNPITSVSQVGDVYAYFSMNESEYFNFLNSTEGKNVAEKLKNIPEVELVLANGQLYAEKGKIQTVTGQINPQTGTIQFRASFPNKDRMLSNGNSGTIRIPKPYGDALVIPETATYEQQGYTYVFVVEKDTAYNRIIEIEDRIDNLAIVKSGLKKGDKIVVEGMGKLKDKSPIAPQMVPFDSVTKPIKPVF
jgi:membrane fusion protein (multidrug efflux system)